MEACMTRPEAKKRPKPPKPPPKPADVQIKRTDPERPTPFVPPRPTDAELTGTQYRVKRAAATINEANGNLTKRDGERKSSETPVAPPRRKEKENLVENSRYSQRRRVNTEDTERDKPEAAKVPNNESNNSGLTGVFRRSQKDKTPSFTSYVFDEEQEEKPGEVPAKQAPGSKPSGLKGVMKGLQFKSSPKTKGSSPATEEGVSEKDQTTEKSKQEKNAEQKQDKGMFSGVFWKTPKDRLSPSLTVNKEDSDSDDAEAEEKTSQEKGSIFSGFLKKSNKPAEETPPQENLSAHSELAASNDSLSENKKEKEGIFSGMFRKSPKPVDAKNDENQQSPPDDVSGSNENLAENAKDKEGFFSGILRKSPKIPVEETPEQDKELQRTELAASSESLSENSGNTKEKSNFFSGMFKKSPKLPEGSRLEEVKKEDSDSDDAEAEEKTAQAKGGIFSGFLKKSNKPAEETPAQAAEPLHGELSTSTDSLSENKEKSGLFSGLLRKTPKASGESQENLLSQKDLSASNDSLSEAKEKGGGFSGMFKKSSRLVDGPPTEKEKLMPDSELSGNNDGLSENNTKEKGGIFGGIFKKPPKPAEASQSDEDESPDKELSASSENLSENKQEKKGGFAGIFKRSASIDNLFDEEKGGLFSGLLKKTPKASEDDAATEDKDEQRELSASNDSLSENANTKEKNIFSGMFKKTPKAAEGTTDEELNTIKENKLSASCENLSEPKEKTGGLAGIFKKSPRPSPRHAVSKDPLSDSRQLSISLDNLTNAVEGDQSARGGLSASNDNLSEATGNTKETKQGGFAGMFRRTPKTVEAQESVDIEPPEGGGLKRRRTIKKKKRVVSFRIKKTLPKLPKVSQPSDKMPILEEEMEMRELNSQESTVEVQPVEMAAFPTGGNPQAQQESDELMEWWNTVKGWKEWNEGSNFQADDEEMALEQAADRVFMAARLFVRLFNQRGASLQQRILELLGVADAADYFHKKTVSAAVGGGVASVAGSITTITGLILAPFTFGASIIVTAVGIGVATAGSIASATANITDTVHSNMDRKKVEKLIQDYQEEIKDIRECMEFVQEGMDTLEEWDFEKYSQSAAKKAMNHNIKHVMKEGGRAGKALMINTDKLISTVQVLGAAGGAAKAAQAISVTTGVMSALFLALDVFFLAKDSHELRKGAKTKFATKIREVCKDLQDGLLELNKVKTQLQKTMDGIEVEEYEEIEEVEEEIEDDLESDPKKLAELDQELDLLEEKLDKKVEEEQKKRKEQEEELLKSKEKNEESIKEKGDPEKKSDKEEEEKICEKDAKKEGKKESKMEKGQEESKPGSKLVKLFEKIIEPKDAKAAKEEDLKEQLQKGSKKDKETENRITAVKEKQESKGDKAQQNTGVDEKPKKVDVTEKEEDERKTSDLKPEQWSGKRESQRSREGERGTRHEWKSVNKEKVEESVSMRRHSSSRSDREKQRGSEHKTRETDKERGSSRDMERLLRKDSDRLESWRRTEDERGVKDWRADVTKTREERREPKDGRESKRETEKRESHRSHETRMDREWRSSREEFDSQRSHHHHRKEHEEKRESRVESARRQFERAGSEEAEEDDEDRRKRREDGESRRKDREHGHNRQGSRSSVRMMEDGLYI
ncbi:hypothetical protein JOB18_048920 [Solea senegalensis]|nr:uncharacterized protein LOC122772061 isoform X1 [Solea senegalensis]XP_043885666.1 uncharacterized protein LOC122772061 isoform X1 [Solea senegalensis]KAG7527086.1 microtubule-associated futsch isoform X1 [Solea senegalensis]KAG7527088.1 hypothetical protein JOB18_048920 [Solea senegalensis]